MRAEQGESEDLRMGGGIETENFNEREWEILTISVYSEFDMCVARVRNLPPTPVNRNTSPQKE